MSGPRHPDDAALAAYAAGAMRAGFDLVVALHLEGCAQCRRAVRAFEAVAATALDTAEGLEMSAGSLAAALARLDAAPIEAPAPAGPLLERLPIGRRRWLAPGAWSAPVLVPHAAQDRVYLLCAPSGMQTLKHGHRGPEFACVVSGALVDEGVRYGPGDFCARDEDHTHQPVVEAGAPCVCLFATQGRLRVGDLVGRLVQFMADV